MKQFFLVTMAMALSFSVSAAEIRNVTARPRCPWSGKVDISYEIVGDVTEGLPEGREPALVVTAIDKASNIVHEAEASALSGDIDCREGTHSLIWDLEIQGLELYSNAVSFSVAVHSRLSLYCIVDLSAGANASAYPVSYLSEPPDTGFNVNEYKTTKMVLRRIDSGTFGMGHDDPVTLTRPFYCGLFEVTQRQYTLVMGTNPSAHTGDIHPVENVSWEMIRGKKDWPTDRTVASDSFVGRLRARTGLSFDLPTEAQWEYACRAGTTSAYNNGGNTEDDLKLLGHYSGNVGSSNGSYHTAVGSYLPNSWGLYDMHGNVFEWCLDYGDSIWRRWHRIDPVGALTGVSREVRGGCWNYDANACQSAKRNYTTPSSKYDVFGFRLVSNSLE